MIYAAATNQNKLLHIDPVTLSKAFEIRLFCEGVHSFIMDHNTQYIYTADSFGKSVSVLDMIRDERKTVGAGSSPSHIALCGRSGKIYAANYDSDSVSVIDRQSLVCLLTIKTGSMPHHLCLSPDEQYLYVSQMGNNQIAAIDTEKNKACQLAELGATPMHMRIGSLSGWIYTACTDFEKSTGGRIIIIDPDNFTKPVKKYNIGKYLSDLCVVEEEGLLYTIDGQENRLYTVDLSTGRVAQETRTGEFPAVIEYDKSTDRIFVGTHMDNTIEGYERKTLQFAGKYRMEGDFGHIEI